MRLFRSGQLCGAGLQILLTLIFVPLLSAAEPKSRIIFLGDSLTKFHDWQKDFPNHLIINQGVGDETTAGALSNLDTLLKSESPRKLFMMLGINDIYQRPWVSVPERLRLFLGFFSLQPKNIQAGMDFINRFYWQTFTVPEIVRNYRAMIFNIRSAWPESEIFVQSVLPVHKELFLQRAHFRLADDLIVSLNTKLKSLCSQEGVVFIDLFPMMADDGSLRDEFSIDGLHLSPAGYASWRDAIAEYLI